MIRAAGVVLLLAVTGCAARGPLEQASNASPTPEPLRQQIPLQRAAPLQVLGYTIADSVRYPQAEAGTLYRYRGGGPLSPDVYLYPRGAAGTVDSDAEGFHRSLEVIRQRGVYGAYEVDSDRSWSPIPEIPGREIVASLHFSEGIRTSYYYIFTVHDQFVKVRITLPKGQVEAETVREFVRALLDSVKP
jgi:hypothetical protein